MLMDQHGRFYSVTFARRGRFVWYVCNETGPIRLLLSSGRPGVENKAISFLIFPSQSLTFPLPAPPILISSSSLTCILEPRDGLMGLAEVLEQALTKSQTALIIWFPFFSCPLFPCLLSFTPLAHPSDSQ